MAEEEEGGGWILGLEMEMETDLVASEHQCRSRGFIQGGGSPGEWSVGHKKPDWTSGKLMLEESSPLLAGLAIADTSPLDSQQGRQSCRRCNRSRKFFCYSCRLPLPSTEAIIPRVELPVRVDIVKHPGEVEGKSTAVHAPIIAPDWVSLHTFPDIPDYSPSSTLLVFPGPHSSSLAQLCQAASQQARREEGELGFPYTRVVFVDSTWNQCHGICEDPRLSRLPCVILDPRSTMFWRYQKGKSKDHLATIEAIYYFSVDFHTQVLGKEYRGEYDNLLFFFKFMHDKIHQLYT